MIKFISGLTLLFRFNLNFRFNLIILLSFNVLFFPDFETLLASIYIEP